MTLICVIMGAPTRDARNEAAKQAFDYGFANYALYTSDAETYENVPVVRGKEASCTLTAEGFSYLCTKDELKNLTRTVDIPGSVTAPLCKGDEVGKIVYSIGDTVVGQTPVILSGDLPEISFGDLFESILKKIFSI